MAVALRYLLVGTGNEAPIMSDIDFGEIIRERREEVGRNQADVAREADITYGTYGRIERGEVTPKLVQIVRIFKALGMTLGSIDEEQEKPERLTARDHLAKIEYHTGELKKLLGG